MQGITKAFPGVLALDHIDLDVEEGEIHALLGENGAGKTTLMNILYGLYRQDGGQIFWEGQPVDISKPDEAIAIGIGMVHQHFMLVRKMTGLENILLGLRLPGYPVMHKEQQIGKIEELCTRYGLSVDLHKRVDRMAVGEQQRGSLQHLTLKGTAIEQKNRANHQGYAEQSHTTHNLQQSDDKGSC